MSVSDVIKAGGGITKLARAIGVHHTTPRDWTRIPAEQVFKVSEATGIPAPILRPDLFKGTDV